MEAKKFEVLTGREQILKRPQMWVGSMSTTSQFMFIIENEKVVYREVSYIPAFKKIIDEIIDNALDAIIQSNKKGKIKVSIDSESITVEDNGLGIPVIKKELSESELKNLPTFEAEELSNTYIPQIAWTRLFSGSNFQDSDNKTTIGSHGLGSKCASIFSTKFVGKTDDGKNSCLVTAVNNLESSFCSIHKTSGKSGTTVQFWPDLEKFNLNTIDKIYSDLTYQRLICLSVSFPDIKFYFNGSAININEKSFLNMFSDNIICCTFKNGFIGVFPNDYDEFIFSSYVNGLNLTRGGSHIDYISNQIITPIRSKLEKKYKNIKPSDIKNRLSFVVFCREFPNPKFDSQTKETLTNTWGEVSSYLKDHIDFEKFSKEILKCGAIMDPIIDSFRIKEELKAKSEIKKVKKIKISADKYLPPTGNTKTYLALCEGASARSGISASLGRNGIGYYAMRGVPLNAYDSNIQKIVANQELKDIISILNLDISKSSEDKTISFDKILITSDNDCYAGNTLVHTDSGLKKIQDITYDDKILSSDDKYHNIKEIITKKTSELVLIEIGNSSLVVSPNQTLLVCRDGEIIEIFAKDILTTDYFLSKEM